MSSASTPAQPSLLARGARVAPRIALAALQVAAIAWFSPGRGLPLDDAWIHQVVARTFAETGTLGYAPGQHGAAATSYLWAALLAINLKVLKLDPSVWALVLNGAAALITGQLLLSLLERARPSSCRDLEWRAISLAATLLACASPNVLWFTWSGMEAMPFVALTLGAIVAATDRTRSRGRAIVSGLSAAGLALLRPEAAPLGAIVAAWLMIRDRATTSLRERARDAALVALPWASAVAVYVGSNLAKTGHAMPSTLAGRRWLWFSATAGLSRGDRALDFLDAWATRLSSYTVDTSLAISWLLIALAAYGALRLAREPLRIDRDATEAEQVGARDPRGAAACDPSGLRLLLAWATFHASFYALLLPTPGHGGRYQPLAPLLFVATAPLGAAFVVHDLARVIGLARRARFVWPAVAALGAFVAMMVPVARSLRHANELAVAHIHATELAAGRFVNELPEGKVASFDIGGSGWMARRPILDLGGLSEATTAALLEQGRISEWLEQNQVRWVVLPAPFEPVLPVFDDFRSRLHLRDNPALRLEPVRVFETPLDKWGPAITATWNAAPKQVVYEVHYTGRTGPPAGPAVDAHARKTIADPRRLVSRADRVVAEHMLAILSAWGMDVDVQLTDAGPAPNDAPAEPSDGPEPAPAAADAPAPMSGPCTVRMGWWGFALEGCASIADPRVLRARAYEEAGRYLDAGDLGGAVRAIPHVFARVRRSVDPRFSPSLAPLMPPTPGGGELGPARAGRSGLWRVLGALAVAMLVELAARRRLRVVQVVDFARKRLTAVPAAALVGVAAGALAAPATGCARPDVASAIPRGRGAVELALEAGASPDALLAAAASGDASIVALLLQRGARLDERAHDGATPLHLAARHGHGSVVAVLVAAERVRAGQAAEGRGVTLDVPAGPRQRTPLHDAVAAGSAAAVAALVDGGANPNARDSFGQTPLHLLAALDPARAAMLAPLLRGADARVRDARGFTALHAAAATDNAPIVRAIASGEGAASISSLTPAGETALDVALRYGRDAAAEELLRAGAEIRHEGTWPPLHDAARSDAIERAASLVASGADVERRFQGKTALEIARERGSKRVEALLLVEHQR